MSLEKPVVVMPPVYILPLGLWRWCRLKEVCAMIPEMASLVDLDFAPSPEDLISRFAAIARRNRRLDDQKRTEKPEPRPKYFRYSQDGNSFKAKLVPDSNLTEGPFELDIQKPYPGTLLVPEGWVIDTLKAIQMGAVEVVSYVEDGKEVVFGRCPHKPIVWIRGPKSGACLVFTG